MEVAAAVMVAVVLFDRRCSTGRLDVRCLPLPL